MTASPNQHSLRRQISAALERYFVWKDRDSNLVLQSPETFEFDGRPEWIPDMLKRTALHDEDYRVFRFLTDPGETFLDIGANYGYSAASVWASGAKCAVLSFEPIVAFEPCLEAIERLRPGRYDYRIMGLGAVPGRARFATPVVNSTALSALTTAVSTLEASERERMALDIEGFIDHHMGATRDVTLRFFEFEAPVETLDNALALERFRVPLDRVAAVKIDTEGFESAVLKGAAETLRRHRPLMMVEHHGNSIPSLGQMLADLGYFYAERDGDVLRPRARVGSCDNGFFVHRDRAAVYRATGLLND